MTRYLELTWAMSLRNIQYRFQQSVIGIGWTVLQPLGYAVALTVIYSILAGNSPVSGIPYVVFVYSAMAPWSFFSEALSRGALSLEREHQLIKQVRVPRILLPTASVLSSVANFAVSILVLLVIMAAYGVPFRTEMLWLPVVTLIQIVFTLGIVFVLSATDVFYRDVKHALPLLTFIWMSVVPIAYPLDKVPDWARQWYLIDPMAGIIESFRRVLVMGQNPDMGHLGIAVGGSVLLLVVGVVFFKHFEKDFADAI